MRDLVGRLLFVVFSISLMVTVATLTQSSASSSQISSKEVLSLVCPTKLTTTSIGGKNQLVCPVCPKFTSSAGENDDFSITQILEGNFLPGQRLFFVRYSGCEPKVKNFGGSFFISKRDNQYQVLSIEDEFGDLGSCKVQPGKDRDQLICGKFICEINNMKFTCTKQKGVRKK